MNERIQQFAEQAEIDYDLRPEIARAPVWIGTDEELEKFAQLIVAECIDVVSDCSVEYCTRPQIVSEIREHFGVEL